MAQQQRHMAIDLTRHHFMLPHKDLCVFGTWLYNADHEADEPALVVVPRYRRNGFVPVCIALSAAFRYDDPRYLAHAARKFNTMLGFEDNMANAHKVADAIHDHLGDLLKMPPNPTTAIIVGEAVITSGGRARTVEITDYDPTPQA